MAMMLKVEEQIHPNNSHLSKLCIPMSSPHYFQRYSQKENVVTNNTLRLFTQLYADHPSRLEDLLGRLIDGVSVDVGVNMQQQTPGRSSVPDGALTQSSFRVILETKLGEFFSVDQLERHLDAFKDEEQRILLLITPRGLDEAEQAEVEQKLEGQDKGVTFATVEFADVVDALIGGGNEEEEGEPLVGEYEQDLYELVMDYKNFCSEVGLLPDDDLMYAVPCGDTHELNFKYDLYYHPVSRGYQKHQYVGIYYDMSIRGIGELKHTVHANLLNGELKGKGVEELTESERERIRGAMKSAPEMAGHSVEQDHEFLIVDKFHKTDFQKKSKYGMRGPQYFSLRDHLEVEEHRKLPSPDEVAEELRGASWR